MNPKISVIIVSYNSAGTISACLESLQPSTDLEIILVDNASTDQTLELARRFHVKLLPQTKNLGYNGGNQVGIDSSSGEIIVLLNPDTVVPPDFASQIRQLLKSHPRADIIGCAIANPSGSIQLTGSRLPTFGSLLYEFSGFQRLFPKSRAYRQYLMLDWDRRTARSVEAVSGACTIIRRRLFDQIGPLDLHYFLYFEELDLGQRVKQVGGQVVYDPSLVVRHIQGASTRQVDRTRLDKIFVESRNYFIQKHHGRIYLWLFLVSCRIFNLSSRLLVRQDQGSE